MRGHVVERLDRALADRLAGGAQLAAGALGEGLMPMSESIVWATPSCSFDATVLAAQPFAVQEMPRGLPWRGF